MIVSGGEKMRKYKYIFFKGVSKDIEREYEHIKKVNVQITEIQS